MNDHSLRSGFISIAQCLRTPLGYEPVDQPKGVSKTLTQGSSGKKVGKYPVLDIASTWAAQFMPILEGIPMDAVPPNTYNAAQDPIRIEDQFYPSLTSCAFNGPNQAMKALNVDIRLSRRGHPGLCPNLRPSAVGPVCHIPISMIVPALVRGKSVFTRHSLLLYYLKVAKTSWQIEYPQTPLIPSSSSENVALSIDKQKQI